MAAALGQALGLAGHVTSSLVAQGVGAYPVCAETYKLPTSLLITWPPGPRDGAGADVTLTPPEPQVQRWLLPGAEPEPQHLACKGG